MALAFALKVTMPDTMALAAGAVIETLGGGHDPEYAPPQVTALVVDVVMELLPMPMPMPMPSQELKAKAATTLPITGQTINERPVMRARM